MLGYAETRHHLQHLCTANRAQIITYFLIIHNIWLEMLNSTMTVLCDWKKSHKLKFWWPLGHDFHFLLLSLHENHATAQAVRLSASHHGGLSSCPGKSMWNCGGQSDSGTGFFDFFGFPCIILSLHHIHLCIHLGLDSGPISSCGSIQTWFPSCHAPAFLGVLLIVSCIPVQSYILYLPV
jgi:hypothetical protein